MAKETVFSIIMHIASLVFFKERNRARQTGDYGTDAKKRETRESLEMNGWIQTPAGTLMIEKATAEEVARGMAERQTKWEQLKELAKLQADKLVDLATWEEIFVLNGKLRSITHAGVDGHRRTSDEIYLAAMINRKKNNLAVCVDIPVIIKTFANDQERLECQIRGNTDRILASKDMSDADMLLAARDMRGWGASQADLSRAFTNHYGQKLDGVLLVDRAFPNLKIIDRMCLPDNNPQHIRFKNRDHKSWTQWAARCDSEKLAKKNLKEKEGGHETTKQATEQDTIDFMSSRPGASNEPPIMKRDDIKDLARDFPDLDTREAFRVVMDNNKDLVKRQFNESVERNALRELSIDGDFPPMGFIIVKVNEAHGTDRRELLERLIAVCEGKTLNNGERVLADGLTVS